MPLTNFPFGLTSFGIPLVGSNVSIPNKNGNVWFVDAVNGSDGQEGSGPATALKTIGAALVKAGSGTGDTIFVFPGTYNENLVITTTDLSIIAAYISGPGVTFNPRPVIEGGLTLPAVKLNQSSRIRIEGFYLHSAGVAAVLIDGGEASQFVNCEIDGDGGAAVQFLATQTFSVNGSGSSFIGCIFDGSVNGILVSKSTGGATGTQATNCVVDDCQFYGNSGPDIADSGLNGANNYWDAWLIKNNTFQDVTKATYLAMDDGGTGATSKCMIAGNYFATKAAVSGTLYALSTGTMFVGNYSAIGVIDGSSVSS